MHRCGVAMQDLAARRWEALWFLIVSVGLAWRRVQAGLRGDGKAEPLMAYHRSASQSNVDP